MGTCKCGRKQEIVKPSEIEKERITKEDTYKEHKIKHFQQHSKSNTLLYLLLAGVVIIIILLMNREC